MGSMLFIKRGKKKGIIWDDMGADAVCEAAQKKCKKLEPAECFDKLEWDGESFRKFKKAMDDEGSGPVSQRGYELHLCHDLSESRGWKDIPKCRRFKGYYPKTFRRHRRRK